MSLNLNLYLIILGVFTLSISAEEVKNNQRKPDRWTIHSARPAKQWQDAFITRHTNAIIPHPAFDLNIKHHRSGKASTCKRSFNLERGVIYADYLTFMILDADIVITDKDVRYPSDHFPVTATIDFKK